MTGLMYCESAFGSDPMLTTFGAAMVLLNGCSKWVDLFEVVFFSKLYNTEPMGCTYTQKIQKTRH